VTIHEKIKPGYRQTDIGLIPEDWNAAPLSDLCALVNGRGFKPHEWERFGYPIIRIQNLNGSDEFNHFNGRFDPKLLVESGQLLFAWSGSRGTSFGPHIWRGQTALLNYHTWKVVTFDKKIDVLFFFHALRQLTKSIEDAAHGASALVHTQKREMENYLVPVPKSLPEQRSVAAALSDADALIASLGALIVKKRDLKQAAMQQLLTGQSRLPGFKDKWEVKRLSVVSWFQEGPGVRNYQFTNSGVKLLNGTNIYRGSLNLETTTRFISEAQAFGQYSHFLVEPGDIVIASSGITIDKFHDKIATVSPSDIPLCLNTSTIRFKPKRECLIDRYLVSFLASADFKRQIGGEATGSAQLNFGPSHLAKVEIRLPPTNEQMAIAAVLSDMDDELGALEAQRDKIRAIKQGMMQELLTGRTRLV
jgi:type I restriction enzyme S subunit